MYKILIGPTETQHAGGDSAVLGYDAGAKYDPQPCHTWQCLGHHRQGTENRLAKPGVALDPDALPGRLGR